MGEFEDEDSNKKKPHRQRLAGIYIFSQFNSFKQAGVV